MTASSNASRKCVQCNFTLTFKLGVVDGVQKDEIYNKQAQIRFGIQGKTTVLVLLIKHSGLNRSLFPYPSLKKIAVAIKYFVHELAEAKLCHQVFNAMVDIMDNGY